MVNGKKEKRMDLELKLISLMEVAMKEIMSTINLKETERSYGVIKKSTQANGVTEFSTEKEPKLVPTAPPTQANGVMVFLTAKANANMPTKADMMANGETANLTAKEQSLTKTEASTPESG